EGNYWAAWAFGSAAIAGNSLVCVMPIVYLTLALRRLPAWGALGGAAMIVAAAAISSWGLTWFVSGGGPSNREIILMMTSLACSSAGVLAGTLWIVRAYGYRLVTGTKKALR